MVYFCAMNGQFKIVILIVFLLSGSLICHAQQTSKENGTKSVFLTPMCVYEGDTIPYVKLPTVYIFKPLKFKNRREMAKYYKLIRDVKKVLPISKEINRAIIETYEYLQTIPTEKGRQKHPGNGWSTSAISTLSTGGIQLSASPVSSSLPLLRNSQRRYPVRSSPLSW